MKTFALTAILGLQLVPAGALANLLFPPREIALKHPEIVIDKAKYQRVHKTCNEVIAGIIPYSRDCDFKVNPQVHYLNVYSVPDDKAIPFAKLRLIYKDHYEGNLELLDAKSGEPIFIRHMLAASFLQPWQYVAVKDIKEDWVELGFATNANEYQGQLWVNPSLDWDKKKWGEKIPKAVELKINSTYFSPEGMIWIRSFSNGNVTFQKQEKATYGCQPPDSIPVQTLPKERFYTKDRLHLLKFNNYSIEIDCEIDKIRWECIEKGIRPCLDKKGNLIPDNPIPGPPSKS